jgi:tight adherence protein C
MTALLEWLPASAVFLLVASGSFGLYLLFRRRTPNLDVAVNLATDPEEAALTAANAFATSAKLRPQMRQLQQELRSAGLYEPNALAEFTAFRVVAALSALACTTLAMFLVPDERAGQAFLIGLAVAGLAYGLPRVVLLARRRRQARAIERDLPLAIDLQVLCLSAGQGLVAALHQTATQLGRRSPILARELAIVCQHAELHSLEHALKQWSDRVQLPEVRNLTMLLMQSERLGTDTAATLHELATCYRISARQRAEAQANRTSFWMLFPSVFCFWVASAIILIAPVYLEFFQYHQHPAQIFDQPVESLKPPTNPTYRSLSPVATGSNDATQPSARGK